jgi:hypothetical protein
MDYTIIQPKQQEMDRNQGLDLADISSREWSCPRWKSQRICWNRRTS